MADIKNTIEVFNLEINIVNYEGNENIVYDPSPRKQWLILKLLGDDYLGSTMTEQRYEVNSKTTLLS